jgi:hypothetical protein
MQHTHPENAVMAALYIIPLVVCLLHSWAYQMQKVRDGWNDAAKDFGVIAFIPIINIFAAAALGGRTVFQFLWFIISFPSRFKKKS